MGFARDVCFGQSIALSEGSLLACTPQVQGKGKRVNSCVNVTSKRQQDLHFFPLTILHVLHLYIADHARETSLQLHRYIESYPSAIAHQPNRESWIPTPQPARSSPPASQASPFPLSPLRLNGKNSSRGYEPSSINWPTTQPWRRICNRRT